MSLTRYPKVSDWITVENDRLLVHTGKVDIGQRISTALAQIAHEELTLPLDQIDIAPVRTDHAPNEGMTSGSNSIETSGQSLRSAAATLREHMLDRLVFEHESTRAEWSLTDGAFTFFKSVHSFSVLALISDIKADIAVDSDVPKFPVTSLQTPQPVLRGLTEMVRGRYTFIHDLDVDGMLHARVLRPPHINARLRDIPQDVVDRTICDGLSLVQDGSFLAITGPTEWRVIKATLKLAASCIWDNRAGLQEGQVFDRLTAENAQRFTVVDGTPTDDPIPNALDQPDLSARFERPFQMHGALAPSAAFAHWKDKVLTLYSHSQGIYPLRDSIADSLSLDQSQVQITHVPGSGCYGHNGADDAAYEAALIAMQHPDQPVLLKWTREDEHAWEPYASAMAVDLSAKLTNGYITAYSADVFSDTHRGRPRPGLDRVGPSKLLANRFRAVSIKPQPATPNRANHGGMHRNLDPIYAFPKRRLVKNLCPDLLHRTSAMRCLGGAANIFAHESFMDEMARHLDKDPIAFRKTHISDKRGLDLLDAFNSQLSDTPKCDGRGIAYAQYKNRMTRVAIAVDIDVNDKAEVALRNVIIVADAGRVIDRDGLNAQLEGGFIQAASWALYEQVTWDRDGITTRDWDTYPVIRFDNIPRFNVTVLNQPNAPSVGAGEATPGPALAAIGNAIFDATSIRMRRMPFTPEAILQSAYSA